jgi:hypothetical protein
MPLKHDPELGSCSSHLLRADPIHAATGQQVLLWFDHARRGSKLAEQQLDRFFKMFTP